MTGPGLLAPLTLSQVNCLHSRLRTAGEDLRELLYGESRVDDEAARVSLLGLEDEISDLRADTIGEMLPAHEREAGAARVAAAERRNHLAAITKAEQLLAAERTAGAA